MQNTDVMNQWFSTKIRG